MLGDVHGCAVIKDDALYFFSNWHDLIDADTALVARAAAGVALSRLVGLPTAVQVFFAKSGFEQRLCWQVDRGLALGAKFARQTLRRDENHAGRNVERGHAHIHQARQRGGGVISVHRREHHVAGLRGLDRNVSGFQIADLAHHDDVGILAQEGAQRIGEIQPGFFVDVDLVDAGQIDFSRIFGSRDIDSRLVQDVQAGIERHGFAAAGRARHQNHAVGAMDRAKQLFPFFRLVAQRVDAKLGRGRVQNPHHNFFAVQRGQCAYPEIDRFFRADAQLHAPVLRHAALGDVQLGNDLDARSEFFFDRGRGLRDFTQLAVHAKADAIKMLEGLEMQVGSAHIDRVDQHFLQEPDHRRIIDFGSLLLGVGCFAAVAEIAQIEIFANQGGDLRTGRLTGLVDDARQLVVFDDDQLDLSLRLKLDLVFRLVIGWVGRRDHQTVAALEQRQNLVALNDFRVDGARRQAGRVIGIEVQQRQ